MITVRQIEKFWDARKYDQLLASSLSTRVEGAMAGDLQAAGALTAAALGMIRLDELNQTHVGLFSKFIRAILAAQQPDGGWGEIVPTAICLRALLIDNGQGDAIDRGINWLADLQQPGGIWPRVPLRRMQADPEVSAFVLLQLGQNERFRQSVRFDDAISWFENHAESLDDASQTLWTHARLRWQAINFAGMEVGAAQSWIWS